ncbi:MAG: septum site-determining protein MinC [Gammaproteobacteria bacterium]|nr:MAG: septum site-determining protein MinC [Gammaproteobacteria bacterium]
MTNVNRMDMLCFQFKASFSPCTIFQLLHYDLEKLEHQLAEMIRRAPHFFQGAPVVIDLEKVKPFGVLNFAHIKQLLLAHNMIPIGARNGSQAQQEAAAIAGLPLVNIGKSNTHHPVEKKAPMATPTKLITHPIRSGMQVYAKGGDLIVTGSISPGAEIMADGHIHVYGPLRGRALAGVQGHQQARIFCRHLDAELVSIAGYYLTNEDMQTFSRQDGMMQVYLDNQQIRIEVI